MPSINNFLQGFSNGLPGLKDYQHASRLYIDNNYELLPKQKFLFHVVFSLNREVMQNPLFDNKRSLELNMLVKSVDLPKFNLNYEQKNQYNKKVPVGTHITYTPVNISFHDDHADVVTAFWKSYYEWYSSDPLSNLNETPQNNRHTFYDEIGKNGRRNQYGRDQYGSPKHNILNSIEIFSLHKNRFTGYALINPRITGFSHDSLDQTEGAGTLAHTMEVMYETVLYSTGTVTRERPTGFASLHYDLEPSPLSVGGRGTTSIFGAGGIVEGIGSVIGDVASGNINLGTIIKGINTYNNVKKINAKQAVKEELKGMAKTGALEVGKAAGTVAGAIGNYSFGASAAVAAVAAGAALTNAPDNPNNTVASNPVIDTVNFLSPSESFSLVQSNSVLRDQVAAAIYYKKVGSRANQTIAQSDVSFSSLTEQQKNVYRASVLTDINALVTNGYIKISKNAQNVTINAEKANL